MQATYVEEGPKTFLAGADLRAWRRVTIKPGTTASPPEVIHAGAGEACIGITMDDVKSGDAVAVALLAGDGTLLVEAAKAVAVGAALYGAADGKVSDAAVGTQQLVALTAATGDGSVIEAAMHPSVSTTAGTVSIEDTGNHFPAAASTAEAALAVLAGGPFFLSMPRFTGWTKDGADHAVILPGVKSPVPVRIKRVYAALGTAPGAGKTLTLKINDTAALSILGTAVTGAVENLDLPVAADTVFTVKVSETADGAGANCDSVFVLAVDDGE